MDHKFDVVAKAMATGQTRREALRWLSGMLGGMLMGSPLIGFAAKGGGGGGSGVDPACRSYCGMHAPGKDLQNCVTACQQCGGNTGKLCGMRGDLHCCSAGQVCVNGACSALSRPLAVCNDGLSHTECMVVDCNVGTDVFAAYTTICAPYGGVLGGNGCIASDPTCVG